MILKFENIKQTNQPEYYSRTVVKDMQRQRLAGITVALSKTIFLLLITVFILSLSAAQQAQATLITVNEWVVHDDRNTKEADDDLFWYRKLFQFTSMTYAEQMDAITEITSNITIPGPWHNDWHMADIFEMTSLWQNDSHAIMSRFDHDHDTQDLAVVAGRYDQEVSFMEDSHYLGRIEHQHPMSNPHIKYELETLFAQDSYENGDLSAWAVTTASPVPEPSTVILFFTGLAGLAFVNRRKAE